MKRMLVLLSFLILTACSNGTFNETASTTMEKPPGLDEKVSAVPQEQTPKEMMDIEKLKDDIKGSIFVKDFSISNSKAKIEYVKDYKEFKTIDPNGKTTEENYIGYWKSGDQIDKVLMGEPIKILKELPSVSEVEMILPFQSTVYKVKWKKSDAEKYFNIDFERFYNDPKGELFETEFIDRYVYDRVEREKFAELYIMKDRKEKKLPFNQTPDGYTAAFNKVSEQNPGVFRRIYPEFITGPEGKILFLKITDSIGLTGIIDDKENITEISLVGITSEDQLSLNEIIAAQYFSISALDSSLSKEDVNQILLELGMNDVKKLMGGTDKNVKKNGIEYRLIVNRSNGIKLIANKTN